jgi:hypothetical protein
LEKNKRGHQMKLSPIVLRLRAADTRFGDMIGGAIELDTALRQTLSKEMAFVVDLGDTVEANSTQTGVVQKVIERFAVVCAVRNDSDISKQMGILAYDAMQDVKEELWKCLVGWDPAGNYDDGNGVAYQWSDGVIEYAGSRLLDVNRGWAWYQYEFHAPTLISSYYVEDGEAVEINGFVMNISGLNNVNKLWTQYMFADDPNLEDVKSLPVDTSLVAMEQYIDETDDPRRGAFDSDFSLGFLLYQGD